MNNKAMILGCNYYIGLSTIRCLGRKGVHTVAVDYSDQHAYGAHSKYTSERLIVPHYSKDTARFIQYLLDYGRRQKVSPVLFPCHDSYLEVIDQHLTELRQVYLIAQDVPGVYTNLMNKKVLHELAQQHDVRVPETVSVHHPRFLQQINEVIGFPCLVKPTDSPSFVARFRKKLFKVHTMEELEASLALAKEAGLEVIVQRLIPGFDDHMYTFDAYLNQHCQVTHWVTCQKLRQYPIHFGASVYTRQQYVPQLFDIGAPFLEAVKWKGFAEIEFKKDAHSGNFYLIEVNCRITNLNELLYNVGMNIPWITYQELTGATPVPQKCITQNTNQIFWYAYEDLFAVRDYVKTGQLSVWQVFRSLFARKVYAIWDWTDPKPAFLFVKWIGSKFINRLFGKQKATITTK